MNLLDDCILVFIGDEDDFETAVRCLRQGHLFIAVAIRGHVCRLQQREHLHGFEIDQFDRTERLRDVEWEKQGMIVWHRDQVSAQVVAPEWLPQYFWLIPRLVPIKDQQIVVLPRGYAVLVNRKLTQFGHIALLEALNIAGRLHAVVLVHLVEVDSL